MAPVVEAENVKRPLKRETVSKPLSAYGLAQSTVWCACNYLTLGMIYHQDNIHTLGAQLPDEGAKLFVKFWNELMSVIESKTAVLERAAS